MTVFGRDATQTVAIPCVSRHETRLCRGDHVRRDVKTSAKVLIWRWIARSGSGIWPHELQLAFIRFHSVDDYGVTHGHGKGKTTEKRALLAFEHEQVDAVIFGHSHIPTHKQIGDITLFNPGSATDKRREKQFSFGLLYIQKNTLRVEHVFYDSKD